MWTVIATTDDWGVFGPHSQYLGSAAATHQPDEGDAQKGTPGLHLQAKCICSFYATTLLFHVRPRFLDQPSMKA